MSLDRELAAYQSRTPRSRALYAEAARVMPGGNSRTTTFFDPYPFYLARGEGARVWDADGVERLDFNGNYTSLILGHAPAPVVKAIQEAAAAGASFPGPTEHEVRLAELVTRRVPSVQALRFTNADPLSAERVWVHRVDHAAPILLQIRGGRHQPSSQGLSVLG